jgi:hypothetical protein
LNVGWLGVFIAPTTKLAVWWKLSVVWRTGHVRCDSHVTRPLGFRPLELCCWARLDDRWRTGQELQGIRCACSRVPDFCALWRALNAPTERLQVTVGAEVVVALQIHRTVRCTPDMSGEL